MVRVVTSERGCGWTGWPAWPTSHRPVCAGKVKKELDHDDGPLSLDETTKLLQDLQEAQAERGGSRPSSNLSSLSNASDRDQHHLGEACLVRSGLGRGWEDPGRPGHVRGWVQAHGAPWAPLPPQGPVPWDSRVRRLH